jgi:hypothetical protein
MAEYLTLVEAAKLTQDPLKKGVIETFARSSAVLERLPLMDIAGQALVYNQEQTLPGIGFRAINSSYTPDVGVINPETEALTVLGGISQVDRALVKMSGNINNLRAIHDGMKSKAAALEFTRCFFRGDPDGDGEPNEFVGLEQRLTGSQVIEYSGTGFLDALDACIDAVQGTPDVLYMSKDVRRALNYWVRYAGQATEVVSDSFGRQLMSYAGIPIGVIEDGPDGSAILGFDEGESNTTSIYAVKFGFDMLSGIQATGGMEVIDLGLVNGVFYQTLIEWLCAIALFHPKCAARLSNLENPLYGPTTTTSV